MNPKCPPPSDPFDPGPGSLAEDLAEVVADARAIQTELGLRPYRVFAVRVHWSGGERGRGDVTQVSERELLPRPKVTFRNRRELTPGGFIDRATVELTEVDVRLTAAELGELFLPPLDKGDEAFVEIRLDGRDGAEAQRRRFYVAEPPERRPFDWRVSLRQQDGARLPSGAVPYPGRRL